MATYTFSLDSYEIKDTRSPHEDTIYVALGLTVNGQQAANAQTKFMGNQNNGTHPVGLSFANVAVPDGAEVTMTYHIVNSGNKNPSAVEQALGDLVGQEIPFTGPVSSWLERTVTGFVNTRCDGPITPPEGRAITWHTFELNGLAPGVKAVDTINERGTDSPSGCGSNSHYIVTFSVTPQ